MSVEEAIKFLDAVWKQFALVDEMNIKAKVAIKVLQEALVKKEN